MLNKSELYATCETLGVPYPETYRLTETAEAATGTPDADATLDEAAEALGFPLVVKPELKRDFEEAFGTNVLEVADRKEFADAVAAAREEEIAVMAQKRVDIATGRDHSLASYVPPSGVGDALAVVGNAAVRFPQQFGTSCLVETADEPAIEARALAVLDDAGYHGISEAEFVYDDEREEFLLLDVNTRPWKWIGMPVAAGANLRWRRTPPSPTPSTSRRASSRRGGCTSATTSRCSRATTCSGTSCRPPTGGGSSPATSSARGT